MTEPRNSRPDISPGENQPLQRGDQNDKNKCANKKNANLEWNTAVFPVMMSMSAHVLSSLSVL